MRIAITGAAGSVAGLIRPQLRAAGHRLVLIDLTDPVAQDGESTVTGSVLDLDRMTTAFGGADLVVHLAGHPQEREWQQIEEVNITGTRNTLEAARLAGVPRVLVASSIHAVGMLTVDDARDAVEPSPAPDTYYGVSKVAAEALGRLYAARFGMTVVAARLCTVIESPDGQRALSTWLSPADLVRLVEACLELRGPVGHVVWGVSANTRRVVNLDAGHRIGFHPQDDAELFAASLGDPPPLTGSTRLGGGFTESDHPVGLDWRTLP